ncbi:MAG: mycothiol transferase [Acidimicrobiia bacterium]
MHVDHVYTELYDRIPPLARAAVEGLDAEQLAWAPADGANTIAWLTWHAARVQDAHVAEIMEVEQLWATGDFAGAFGLEPDPSNSGFGHGPDDIAAVRPEGPEAVLRYLDTVHERTERLLVGLTDSELDRIVDRRWDPPVTLGVRLVSIADDSLQHVGQALYVRGLLDGYRGPGDPRS